METKFSPQSNTGTQTTFLYVLAVSHSLAYLPELITITEDDLHILVKWFKAADEDPAVLQEAPHSKMDVLQYLAALSHRHDGCFTKSKFTVNFQNP